MARNIKLQGLDEFFSTEEMRQDDKRIAFSSTVELSYLKPDEQRELLNVIRAQDCTPLLSQAQRMKKFSQINKLTPEVVYATMTEEKPNQREQLRIPTGRLRQYFHKDYTVEQMEQTVIKLLEERQKKIQRNRDMER